VVTLVRPPGRADHGRAAASEAADIEVAMAVDENPQPASVAGSTMTAVRQGLVPGWLDRLAAIGWRVLVVIALALVFASLAVFLETVTGAILVGLTVAATGTTDANFTRVLDELAAIRVELADLRAAGADRPPATG